MGLQRNSVWYGAAGALAALLLLACEDTRTQATPAAIEAGAGLPAMRPDRLAEATPQQEQFHLAAVAAYERGDSNSAVTALLALRDTQPYSALRTQGLLLLAELYYQDQKFDEAVMLLVALRDQTPPDASLEYVLGRALVAADRLVEAEDALRRAIRVDPRTLRSHLVLADMLQQAGRTEDAEAARLRFVREVQHIDALFREPGEPAHHLALVQELGRTVVDDTVARALAVSLRSEAPDVRSAAAAALQRVGTPVAVVALETARANATDAAEQAALDAALAAIATRFPPPPPRPGRTRR